MQSVSDAHRLTADDVAKTLDTDLHRGLTDGEAAKRLAEVGRNELTAEQGVPAWRRFLAQFRDVLVILLLVATAVSVALWFVERVSALPYEAIAIFAVVLLNATMGFIQETRAEAAVAALRAMSASEASVIRSGERRHVPAAELVPGDVVLIEQGDTIPADGRIVESTALMTAEAALTGESLPVSKNIAPLSGDVAI
ncbi:MAG TPA: HAD-IC family P-type ATPase, partial [Gemmatimonadaceae bacterium]